MSWGQKERKTRWKTSSARSLDDDVGLDAYVIGYINAREAIRSTIKLIKWFMIYATNNRVFESLSRYMKLEKSEMWRTNKSPTNLLTMDNY
jgi:hypothetical protein